MRYIPRELVNIILEYDGRIQYRRGHYVNIIHKHDYRYDAIAPLLYKKLEIMKTIETSGHAANSGRLHHPDGFYFEVNFDTLKGVVLCYDYHFSYWDVFEICYVDLRKGGFPIQIRSEI